MQLQGRNLSLTMNDKDVKLQQEELLQLVFSINGSEGYFAKTTLHNEHS